MQIDLLESWKKYIVDAKWKHGLIENHILSNKNIDYICESLKRLFPRNHFLVDSFYNKNLDTHWVRLILSSEKIISIFQLKEICDSLNFYELLENRKELKFFKSNRDVDEANFRNDLFEILIIRLLKGNNLEVLHNQSYTDNNGMSRPLDACINYMGKNYLIECRKIHNLKYKNLMQLAREIEVKVKRVGQTKLVRPDHLITGYIGFKTSSANLETFKKSRSDFQQRYKEYFSGLTNTENNEIRLPGKLIKEDFDIVIDPIFLGDDYRNYAEEVKEYKSYLSFKMVAPKFVKGEVIMNFRAGIQYQELIKFVARKVKEKFKQHKDSDLEKIVCIEIENTYLENPMGKSLPLVKEDFKSEEFTKLIKDKQSVLVLIKDVSETDVKYEIAFLSRNNSNDHLLEYLKNIKVKFFK